MSSAALVADRPVATARAAPTRSGAGADWTPLELTVLEFPKSPETRQQPQPAPAPEPAPVAPVIDAAELEAIRQQARDEAAAEGRREGLAAGYAEGYRVGAEAGQAAVDQQAAQLVAIAASLPQALNDAGAALAPTVTGLAVEIARRLVHRALDLQPEQIVSLVHELMNTHPPLTGQPLLHLHPLDAELVRATAGAELKAAGWQLRVDDAISRGGCRVVAHSGEIDATVQTRWDRAMQAVGLAGSPVAAQEAS